MRRLLVLVSKILWLAVNDGARSLSFFQQSLPASMTRRTAGTKMLHAGQYSALSSYSKRLATDVDTPAVGLSRISQRQRKMRSKRKAP
jgi:hypothetical protein